MLSPYSAPFQTLQKKFGTDTQTIKRLDTFNPTDMRQVAYFASIDHNTYSEDKFSTNLGLINHDGNKHFRRFLKEVGAVVNENALFAEYSALLSNGLTQLNDLTPFFYGHSSIDAQQNNLDALPQVLKEFLIDEHRKKKSNPVSVIDIENDSSDDEKPLSAGESDNDDTDTDAEENHNKSALKTFLSFAHKYRFYGACAAGSLAIATAVSLVLYAMVGFPILITFALTALTCFSVSAFALSKTEYGDLTLGS